MRKLAMMLISLVIIASMAFAMSATAFATHTHTRLTASAGIVIDFETGMVLYAHNADEMMVPASMIKILAVAVVLEAIEDGRITFDTRVQTSYAIASFSVDRRFSNVPMPVGSSFTVRELVDAVMQVSAGAATVALGELLYGSEAAFVRRMSEKVESFGLEAEVADSWGISPNNRISAYNMAQLARAIIREYPIILEISAQSTINFNNIAYNSTNRLLGNFYGLDGLKTGFTNAAGWCFVGTAMRGGRRLVAVAMNSSTVSSRFSDTSTLLNYGFTNYNATFTRHFRSQIEPMNDEVVIGNALVPISLYSDLEYRELFTFLQMMSMLND